MKLGFLIVGMLVSFILQLFFLQGWQGEMVVANILLSFLVVASLYASKEQLLWMALFAGLVSDLYSNLDFGFYLGFYLLLAIVCKYLMRFGEAESSLWRLLLVLLVAALLQALLVALPLLSLNLGWAMAQNLFAFVTLTVIAGAVWYLLLNQFSEFTKNMPKLTR